MIHEETRVLIKTERLCKSFSLGQNMSEALKEVDMRITQGEFIVIEGLYGVRKNVFFNLIGCLERPNAGKYYFDYEDIGLASKDVMNSIRMLKIGYIFRDFKLVSWLTVAENVGIPVEGLDISKKGKENRIYKALRSFGIEAIAAEKASNLTNLQKQLVSLARAVVNEPLMIIADEPAANLNDREEQEIMEHLFRMNSDGMTIMLITQKTSDRTLNRFRSITFTDGKISGDTQVNNLSLVRKEA